MCVCVGGGGGSTTIIAGVVVVVVVVLALANYIFYKWYISTESQSHQEHSGMAPPANPIVVGALQAGWNPVEASTRPHMQTGPTISEYGFPGRL